MPLVRIFAGDAWAGDHRGTGLTITRDGHIGRHDEKERRSCDEMNAGNLRTSIPIGNLLMVRRLLRAGRELVGVRRPS